MITENLHETNIDVDIDAELPCEANIPIGYLEANPALPISCNNPGEYLHISTPAPGIVWWSGGNETRSVIICHPHKETEEARIRHGMYNSWCRVRIIKI